MSRAGNVEALVPESTRPIDPSLTPRRKQGCLPVVVVCIGLMLLFWFVVLRDSDDQKPSARQVEAWRANVAACLAQRDPDCADEALSQLRSSVASEYWSDLLLRSQQLRQERAHAAERDAAQQEQQERAQLARDELAAAQTQEQAMRDQMSAAEAAAELVVPGMPASNGIAERPPRLDAESQRRNPVRYPPEAMRSGTGGTTLLDIDVGPNGSLIRTSIVQSSGDRTLDRAAQDAVRRWIYEPALSNGQSTFGTLRLPVEFVAPQGPQARDAFGRNLGKNSGSNEPEAGLLDKGRAELRAGRFDVALALGESALQMNPGSVAAQQLIQQARSERERVMSETTIE